MNELLAEFGFESFEFKLDLSERFLEPKVVAVDFKTEENRIKQLLLSNGDHSYQTCENIKTHKNTRTNESRILCNCKTVLNKARSDYVTAGVQCERIVTKSPALTSTARFFALSARHAALLDEINDLNDEIEFLNSKLRNMEDKRREVLALCASYLDCSFKLRSDLKLFISKDGRVALKNPELKDTWAFLN